MKNKDVQEIAKMTIQYAKEIIKPGMSLVDLRNDLEKKIILLAKTKKKLSSLKHGSICVLNQIRTISKMRLIDPKDKYDVLYGLRLSNTNLTKIENKIIELYANQELDMRK